MRLQWATRAPDQAAERLGALLGVTAVSVDGCPTLNLGGVVLEVVALPLGVPGDDRLRFCPPFASDGNQPSEANVVAALRCVGVGLATVDTERIASQQGLHVVPAAPDLVLGARASDALGPGIARIHLLILEPRTEGRVAASLARWGEGPVALYLRPSAGLAAARDRVLAGGGRVTSTAAGPFGRSFAVAEGPAWGPHLVIVESDVVSRAGGVPGPA